MWDLKEAVTKEKDCSGDKAMARAAGIVMIHWVTHGFGFEGSTPHWFAHPVYYTAKDILTTTPVL